ncbi:SRPBCC family protein [Marinoscillum pacificum]|uniref:SRPBCC family protein n=1 Tax=Marinoscillum pacificum TaxID=392723 RepID=UPI0021582BBE|nr:SRPBCC family protein [Marinoscillum pacificum]
MNNYGELIDQNTLQFKRLLSGKIERVWQYLTDSELRGKWFASGAIDLNPQGAMELNFHHQSLSKENDPIPEKYQNMKDGSKSSAVVLKAVPPSLLVIDWEGKVTFDLEQIAENQVLLTLTHERLQDSRDYKIGVFAGWHTHLDILVDVVAGAEPKGFWRVHMPLEEEYATKL